MLECSLIGFAEQSTVAHKAFVGFFEQALLWAGEVKQLLIIVNLLHLLEQLYIHAHLIGMCGEQRTYFLRNLFHLGSAVALRQGVVDIRYLGEQLTAVVEGKNGVVEVGTVTSHNNGVDFLIVLFNAGFHCRYIVGIGDVLERRNLVFCGVFRHERILMLFHFSLFCAHRQHGAKAEGC